MVLIEKLRRPSALAVAALLLLATAIPLFSRERVSAALLANRSIQMSSSANGSGAAGQKVIYKVGFTVSNAATAIGGIVIDFCSNSPIAGDSCTATTGSSNFATLSINNQNNISGLTVDTTNSTANKVILTKTAGAPTAAAISFELGDGINNGFTNPTNSNTVFYARIYTYTTSAAAQGHNTGTPTGYTDNGGIALSTAEQITITAKVQERLTFCVYTGGYTANDYTNPTLTAENNCTSKSGSAVTLGDNNGVLTTNGAFVDKTARYSVSSNAVGSVAIRLKGTTLKSGSFDIAAIGATAASSTAGSEQFGFCTWQIVGATLTISTPYDNASCNSTTQTAGTGSTGGEGTAQFAFDETNTNTTYGQTIASATAGDFSTGELAFIGNIANTTEAGIYTTTLTFIATGTY
jgi:hypothetical protein